MKAIILTWLHHKPQAQPKDIIQRLLGLWIQGQTNKYGLGTTFKLDPHGLTNISANYYKKPRKLDWFIFPAIKRPYGRRKVTNISM